MEEYKIGGQKRPDTPLTPETEPESPPLLESLALFYPIDSNSFPSYYADYKDFGWRTQLIGWSDGKNNVITSRKFERNKITYSEDPRRVLMEFTESLKVYRELQKKYGFDYDIKRQLLQGAYNFGGGKPVDLRINPVIAIISPDELQPLYPAAMQAKRASDMDSILRNIYLFRDVIGKTGTGPTHRE